MDAKLLLDRRLEEYDYELLGQAVVNGYKACDDLFNKNVVLGEFVLGRDYRPRLISLFVEHSLSRIAASNIGWESNIKYNDAGNCLHLRLSKEGIIFTSHFMGQKKFRPMARKAGNRESLASRNGDLFAHEASSVEFCGNNGIAYCHIRHGGKQVPEHLFLAIPNRSQSGSIGAAYELPKPSPQKIEVEEIEDEVRLELQEQVENVKKQRGLG